MRRPFACLSALALLLAPAAADALVVPVNHSARLSIAGTASSVIVGNPAIADVTVVDSHTIYVMGRSHGATDVVVLDSSGRTLFNGDVSVGGRGGDVALYRGAQRTDVACDPTCTESAPQAAPESTGQSTGGATSAGGVAANAVTAALGAGVQSVASHGAMSPNP